MLLGYHLLWSTTANVVGTPEQAERFQELILSNNYFLGGAVNPRDADLTVTDQGDQIVFHGRKHFNTGGVISDLTVLEGVLAGTDQHVFAIVPTRQAGITFAYNWDNIGVRLSESGSVAIDNVAAPWHDALGWDAQTKAPVAAVAGLPFASLLLPTIQLVFSNFYLGIAQGALDFASKYTATQTRAWPYGGDVCFDNPFFIFYVPPNIVVRTRKRRRMNSTSSPPMATFWPTSARRKRSPTRWASSWMASTTGTATTEKG